MYILILKHYTVKRGIWITDALDALPAPLWTATKVEGWTGNLVNPHLWAQSKGTDHLFFNIKNVFWKCIFELFYIYSI